MKNFLIASAALLAGTAALAQTTPAAPAAPPAPIAHPMSDATMTRDEVVAMVRDHFGRMDSDKNGSITTDEVMKGHDRMAGKFREMHIERSDGDKGGEHHIMRLERRDPKEAFERLDTNKDGAISFDEFSKARDERIEKRIKVHERRDEAGKDGKWRRKHAMHLHHGGMMGGRMIVMADTDHDGKITLAEAQSMALQHFDQMDANHDGKVTPEERRAGRPVIIKQVIEEKKTTG
jgi:Ca2+-binding EF-hand superfamily protein